MYNCYLNFRILNAVLKNKNYESWVTNVDYDSQLHNIASLESRWLEAPKIFHLTDYMIERGSSSLDKMKWCSLFPLIRCLTLSIALLFSLKFSWRLLTIVCIWYFNFSVFLFFSFCFVILKLTYSWMKIKSLFDKVTLRR